MGSEFLKTNQIPASGHQFFRFFPRFFEVEAFPYRGNVIFNKSFIRLVEPDFLEETLFFDQSYFSTSGNHHRNYGKAVFKEKSHSCYWTTDFPASGNHFVLHFSETPANASFFPSSGKVFFNKILNFG